MCFSSIWILMFPSQLKLLLFFYLVLDMYWYPVFSFIFNDFCLKLSCIAPHFKKKILFAPCLQLKARGIVLLECPTILLKNTLLIKNGKHLLL